MYYGQWPMDNGPGKARTKWPGQEAEVTRGRQAMRSQRCAGTFRMNVSWKEESKIGLLGWRHLGLGVLWWPSLR